MIFKDQTKPWKLWHITVTGLHIRRMSSVGKRNNYGFGLELQSQGGGAEVGLPASACRIM